VHIPSCARANNGQHTSCTRSVTPCPTVIKAAKFIIHSTKLLPSGSAFEFTDWIEHCSIPKSLSQKKKKSRLIIIINNMPMRHHKSPPGGGDGDADSAKNYGELHDLDQRQQRSEDDLKRSRARSIFSLFLMDARRSFTSL
jgi:hypothetical protein